MTITVNTPDGGTVDFPDGTPPETMTKALRAKFGGPAPAPAPADQGVLAAGENAITNAATFGQAPKLAALMDAGLSHVLPGKVKSYDQALQEINDEQSATAAAHPIASMLGSVGGLVAGGAEIGAAGEAIVKVPAVAGAIARATGIMRTAATNPTVVGRTAAALNRVAASKVGQMAATGAGVGGAQSALSGDAPSTVAANAAIGGIAGPAVGTAVEAGAKVLAPASVKAMRLLGSSIDESPVDIQKAFATFQARTGRLPSMAEIVDLKSQGALKDLAANNPTIGVAAVKAAQADQPTGNIPQTLKGLTDFRDERMDTAMGAIRNTPVPLSKNDVDFLLSPQIKNVIGRSTAAPGEAVTAADKLELARQDLANATPYAKSSRLTLDDIDNMREQLRNEQSSLSNSASNNHDRVVARRFGQRAERVANLGASASPDYTAALQQYSEDSDYIHGFTHGQAGKAVGDAKGPVSDALNTVDGKAGYEHGSALNAAQQSLSTIAPRVVEPPAGVNPAQIAHGALALAKPGPLGAYHAIRAIRGLRVSDEAQQRLAGMLFDPSQRRAALRTLQANGADQASLQALGNMAARYGAVTATAPTSGQQ